jgi:hypothetical protein
MMIDITLAKIGRSTKKWENRMPAVPSDGMLSPEFED